MVKTAAGCLDKILFIPNASLLSVNIISFIGDQQKNEINLKWIVEKNETMDRFEIEKSTDGISFVKVGIVFTSEKQGRENYSFPDKISQMTIYRLRIIGKTGLSAYSKNLSFEANNTTDNSFTIINSAVQGRLNARFESGSNLPAEIKIIDMTGRVLLQQKVSIGKGSNLISIPISPAFNKGLYIVDFFDGKKHYTAKFVFNNEHRHF